MERLRRSENRMAGPAASGPPVRPVHASFLGVALGRGPDEHRRHWKTPDSGKCGLVDRIANRAGAIGMDIQLIHCGSGIGDIA